MKILQLNAIPLLYPKNFVKQLVGFAALVGVADCMADSEWCAMGISNSAIVACCHGKSAVVGVLAHVVSQQQGTHGLGMWQIDVVLMRARGLAAAVFGEVHCYGLVGCAWLLFIGCQWACVAWTRWHNDKDGTVASTASATR